MITAKQVSELRNLTGAGMMDCKKALSETDGNIEAAVDWLREKVDFGSCILRAISMSRRRSRPLLTMILPYLSSASSFSSLSEIDHKASGVLRCRTWPCSPLKISSRGQSGVDCCCRNSGEI